MLDVSRSREWRDRYCRTTPWPHLVVDGVVPRETAADVAGEVARLSSSALVGSRSRRQLKLTSADPERFGLRTRQLLEQMSGTEMRNLAEAVTGIRGLVADPLFCRAGVFVTPPGGWQRVHEDFPAHPQTGLWNRVIVLLYCSDWAPGCGGELELWPRDMSAVVRRIEPRPGRLVMFETTSAHPHGVKAVAESADPRVALACRFYAPVSPLVAPSPPLWRWSRRPAERRRDVWPTMTEVVREVRSQAGRVPRAVRRRSPHVNRSNE